MYTYYGKVQINTPLMHSRILICAMSGASLGLDNGQFANAQQWNNLPAHYGFLTMSKVINKVYTP